MVKRSRGKAAPVRAERPPRTRPPAGGSKPDAPAAKDRASPAIEAVLAGFAHDIRTPLTGILAFAELLATSELGEQERRWIRAIKDEADHLAELTTLIIEGERVASGQGPRRAETFDLGRFTASLADSLTARAEAKNLACEIRIPSDLPPHASGDPVQLRAAMENLIANAVKFTERGTVRLAVEAQPSPDDEIRLTFTVADTGIGISAAEIKRLFRPFSQANPEIVRKFGGSGLGLVQVRRVAKSMRGDLDVDSTPGSGTTFRLAVMVGLASTPPEDAHSAAGQRDPKDATWRPLRILCVEDNPYGRVVIKAILTELGHTVDFTGSGESAAEIVGRGGHDVVLMDITLPGIDGFEAARRIRALPGEAARVPIIALSGRSRAADAAEATAAGMDGYLVKPVSPRVLAETLTTVTKGRSAAGN